MKLSIRHFALFTILCSMVITEGCAILVPPPFINAETEIMRDNNGKIVGSKYTRKVTGFTFEGDPETAETWANADRTAFGTITGQESPLPANKPINTRTLSERKKLKEGGFSKAEIDHQLNQPNPPTYNVEQLPPPRTDIPTRTSSSVYNGVLTNETNKFRVAKLYQSSTRKLILTAELEPDQSIPLNLPEGTYYVEWYTDGHLSITAEPFSVNPNTNKIYKGQTLSWVQRIYIIN